MVEAKIAEGVRAWKQHGWAVVDGLIPRDRCAQALTELRAASPQDRAKPGPVRRPDQADTEVKFRGRQFDGTTLFPFPGAPTLNRLFVDPGVVALAAALLETEDLRLYQSRVWSKYGEHTNFEQPHHRDMNHSLIPTRHDSAWGHVEMFIYLHDVDEQSGAPKATRGFANGLGGAGTGRMPSPDDWPELYASEQSAIGSAGTVFAYRSDVYHRGVDIPPGVERHVMVAAFRPAAVDWIGFDSHEPLVSLPDWVAFAEDSTPEELALFGIPRPGHPFWTNAVLDAMAKHYRGLDLTPWRQALAAS